MYMLCRATITMGGLYLWWCYYTCVDIQVYVVLHRLCRAAITMGALYLWWCYYTCVGI